ncbi:MAG TPA: hypothetical protein VGS57_08610 [Thermoanaerobaculia bacterium]|jgi:hypothetical protein|nr:hypothetical protein [Thermoanaerobaculia bacterium]
MRRSKTDDLSTDASRHFVRLARTVGIGVPVALAPLLGAKVMPFFAPLLTVLSADLKGVVLPFSIIIVTFVALTLEFYVRERITAHWLRWVYPIGGGLLVAALYWLFVLQTSYVIRLPVDGGREIGIAKTKERMPGCPCGTGKQVGDLHDLECVHKLTVDPTQLEKCWDGPELVSVRLRLAESYLLAIFLLTSLIAVVVLRITADRPRRPARPRRPRRPPKAVANPPVT